MTGQGRHHGSSVQFFVFFLSGMSFYFFLSWVVNWPLVIYISFYASIISLATMIYSIKILKSITVVFFLPFLFLAIQDVISLASGESEHGYLLALHAITVIGSSRVVFFQVINIRHAIVSAFCYTIWMIMMFYWFTVPWYSSIMMIDQIPLICLVFSVNNLGSIILNMFVLKKIKKPSDMPVF